MAPGIQADSLESQGRDYRQARAMEPGVLGSLFCIGLLRVDDPVPGGSGIFGCHDHHHRRRVVVRADADRWSMGGAIHHKEVDMCIRTGVIWALLAVSFQATAQMSAATGPKPKPLPAVKKPHYNSMAKGTTPFNCEAYRAHPHPGMKGFCEGVEADTLQNEARRAGRPGPSTDVIRLPALGTEGARRSGLACIGGQAMRKLPNGRAQVSSSSGGWQRCREE